MSYVLQRLVGHAFLSTTDGFIGYYTFLIRPWDQKYLVHKTPFGTFTYTMMLMRLKNNPQTHQKFDTMLYKNLLSRCVELYLDDSSIFPHFFEKHILDLVACLKAGIRLKLTPAFQPQDDL